MIYWPGTKIVKSQNNVFTSWKEDRPSLANNLKWKQSVIGKKNASIGEKVNIVISKKQ